MTEQDFQIHLRRRFVEQAQARRPRLPGNLKQLDAVGPVLRPLATTSRQAVVKVGITKGSTTGKHLSYLTHEKGPGRQNAMLFGPAAPDTRCFVQDAQQDRHQFRLVVSVPDHRRLDQTRYIELFMAQVERDLGRPLDWMAAHHADTQHPHTHIVLRGQDRHGKDLYMEKDYLAFGLRARASQLLTWLLGPVRQQQFIQSDRLTHDGVLRGLDDPDQRARALQQPFLATTTAPQPMTTLTADGRRQAEVLAALRMAPQPSAALRQETGQTSQASDAALTAGRLTARVVALQQALQAQQAMQRGQGIGF